MFDDLDVSLAALLADPAAPAELRAADITFETPDRDYKPGQPTVNLFLHEVTENRALRDDAHVMARDGDRWTSRMPSLRVECTYLVTAWSPRSGGFRAAEEHRLLGLTLRWLGRFAVLEEQFLRGTLATPPQPFPLPTVLARTQEGRSNAEFWTALGISPRPAVSLAVTVSVDPWDDVEEFAAVQDVRVRARQIPHPELSGQVLQVHDAGLVPVPGAAVTVVETGATTVSGADGGFALPGVAFGQYTLQVEPTGGPAEEVAVEYRPDHQTRTVVLGGP